MSQLNKIGTVTLTVDSLEDELTGNYFDWYQWNKTAQEVVHRSSIYGSVARFTLRCHEDPAPTWSYCVPKYLKTLVTSGGTYAFVSTGSFHNVGTLNVYVKSCVVNSSQDDFPNTRYYTVTLESY